LVRWKRLFQIAGGLRRVGKVFFVPLAAKIDLEKTFPARWRATARRTRRFQRAGGRRRLKKDFFGMLAGHGAPEKTFLGRWRAKRAKKSGHSSCFLSQTTYWNGVYDMTSTTRRDARLPKLPSGEIRVAEAKRRVEDAGCPRFLSPRGAN